jgi:hypothetical protein
LSIYAIRSAVFSKRIVARCVQKCSDNDHNQPYSVEMDSELSDSLEAIANLLYLIRKSLNNPAAISAYVGLAEDRIRVIAINTEQGIFRETRLGCLPYGPPLISPDGMD